jgi:hypothetical protein
MRMAGRRCAAGKSWGRRTGTPGRQGRVLTYRHQASLLTGEPNLYTIAGTARGVSGALCRLRTPPTTARAATAEDRPRLAVTVTATARRATVHPVVLRVLLGLCWNLTGLPVPGAIDGVLRARAGRRSGVLVVIGMTLAHYGTAGVCAGALALSAVKLLIVPATVLAAAYRDGLRGTALTVVVLCAALPIGSNALLFAQRYAALAAETTAGVVASTLAFAETGPRLASARRTPGPVTPDTSRGQQRLDQVPLLIGQVRGAAATSTCGCAPAADRRLRTPCFGVRWRGGAFRGYAGRGGIRTVIVSVSGVLADESPT